MPTYTYRCDTCTAVRDEFNRVAECESAAPECCGARMRIKIQPVMGSVQGECHYRCPATGQMVTSWKQREEIFAKYNLMDARDHTPEFVKRESDRRIANDERIAAEMDMPDEFDAAARAEIMAQIFDDKLSGVIPSTITGPTII